MTLHSEVVGAITQRVDRTFGIREEVGFFGGSGAKRFGWRAHPLTPPLGALVVCSTIHADAAKQYRREVLFGREAAAAGFVVQRFHYRGHGNSDGEGSEVTFTSMRDDALAAADELRLQSGLAEPMFLGIGWGGLVAAEATRSGPTPLALWQPVLAASAFFATAMRARAIRDLKEGRPIRSTEEEQLAELRRTGSLDVLGYSIDRSLYDSSFEVRLEPLLRDQARKVLLLQVAKGKSLHRDYQELADSLTRAESSVETGWIEAEDRSWFIENEWRVEEDRTSTHALVDRTTAWMLSAQREEASA